MDFTHSLEEKTKSIGKDIFQRVKSSKQSFFDISFWSSKFMELAMKDEDVKVQLFRFVDVLPTLKTDEQLSRHIQEYFGNIGGDLSGLMKAVTQLGTGSFIGKLASSVAIRQSVMQMAKTFIAGENVKEVIKKVLELRKKKMGFTIDILGEAVLSEKEAEFYQKLYLDLISGLANDSNKWDHLSQIDEAAFGKLPKVNISVKLSSLYSQIDSMNFKNSVDKLKDKLRPILKLAKQKGVFIYVDMEDFHMKDITITVFKEILMEDEFKTWLNAGLVIQAYLKESGADLKDLISWVKNRGTPISVRLVKGAYWDYETISAKQQRWEIPVYEHKEETDENYERLSKLLIYNYPDVYPAIASHNIRSLAHAKAYAEEKGLPKNALEYQFLFGMADPVKEAFVDMGERVRVYTPYGELIPGMAYLVRRLLENTANESFLRQGFQEGISEDELLKSPIGKIHRTTSTQRYETHHVPSHGFLNIPDTDFTIAANREKMQKAISELKMNLGKKYPLVIDGKKIDAKNYSDSINPSNKSEIVGKFALATVEDADVAVRAAVRAFPTWRDTGVQKRAEILFKAARIMEERRFELVSLMVLEEGKPWKEADGDVSEAIDFLNYYGRETKRLFEAEKLLSPCGEDNVSFYQPRGVCAVISPWNFPLAILTGMSSAALASGNAVIIKPAKQASIIAARYVEILIEAGIPNGVCNYLPGDGRTIGNYLVKHKDVNLIAFTGSMEVGLAINKLATDVASGQHFVKKVICEMGGKNAIIVDDDADLDEAVKGVIYSAFGYAGQKCSAASRIIVVKDAYDRFLERLEEAARSIVIGPAEDPGSYLGPIIDESAFQNTKKYIEIGKLEAKLLTGGDADLAKGFFITPTIFVDVHPNAKIAQEEIFAPVLAVLKAENIDEAIAIANGVQFALTGGLFSRSPANIKKVRENFRVGNLYINRGSTGAKVARQPFGGFKMSGIGSKAGGKDYLLQFVEPRVITENTMRRGFAPE
ncbi:MAG: L-glutamate gamma-semialdehyde dehydrogenase [Candidatus Melainabacteria bacterium]|nr:L-glutamate gamma-semialdehyde dehydrogenase [Candidatus Melainabacteria bacterium]